MIAPRRLAAAAVLALAGLSSAARAQEWRSLQASRQLRDSGEHVVHVRYGAGRLTVRPTSQPVLYSMELSYDESFAAPLSRYDAAGRTVTVGLDIQRVGLRQITQDHSRGELRLGLSRAVPMALDVDVGAARTTLELGGLAVRSLRLDTGASETSVSFDVPNAARMELLDADVGAAGLTMRGLGNANVRNLRLSGGAGSVDLDFSGEWREPELSLRLEMALGRATLRVPEDVGIRVELERFLASFEHPGLERRGDAFYSRNWDSASRRLRVRASTAFGGLHLERLER